MGTWIRLLYENGDSTLFQSERVMLQFKVEQKQIEVHSLTPAQDSGQSLLSAYQCEYPEQVTAAEDLVMNAASSDQPVTISLELLDEHAEYLNHVNGLRMVLQLLHQGTIRIPIENDLSENDLFDQDPDKRPSELSQFEEMLYTYLDVPDDSLRRAIKNSEGDAPFELNEDHEECPEHGFHEYWVVAARPDRHYMIRERYDELAKTLIEKEGYAMASDSHSALHPAPSRLS